MVQERIVIMGATGRTGRETLVNLLGRPGVTLRAVANANGRPAAPQEGVEFVTADYTASDSMRRALHGAQRVFWVTPGGLDQIRYTEIMVDAARLCGVQHIVKIGNIGCDTAPITETDVQCQGAEKHIRQSGCKYTFLRGSWYNQIFTHGGPDYPVRNPDGSFVSLGEGKAGWVDCRDIGAVAAAALTAHDHYNKTYTMTGPEALSFTDLGQIMSAVAGRPIIFRRMEFKAPPGVPSAADVEKMQARMAILKKLADGLIAEVTDHVQHVLGRPPIAFNTFAQDHAKLLFGA